MRLTPLPSLPPNPPVVVTSWLVTVHLIAPSVQLHWHHTAGCACVFVSLFLSLSSLTDRGTLEQFVSHPSCVLPCLGCSRPRMENFSSRLLSCMPPPFLYCTSASRSFAAHWLSLSLSLLRLCVPGGCLRRGHFLTELARALDTIDQARSDGV